VNLNDLHRRLLQDVLASGNAFPFVITGGYAVQAHGLVDRLSRDIDVATETSTSMDAIASTLVTGLRDRGWRVRIIGIEPLSARFMVTDPELDQDCEVDILKEAFNRPPKDTRRHRGSAALGTGVVRRYQPTDLRDADRRGRLTLMSQPGR
jgi:hypothetical protein